MAQQISEKKRTCYKHGSRQTNLLCAHCGRPICSECLVDAPVGFQCRRCTKEKVKPSGALAKVHHRRRVKRGVTKVVRTVFGFGLVVAAVAGYVWVQDAPGREPSAAKPAVPVPRARRPTRPATSFSRSTPRPGHPSASTPARPCSTSSTPTVPRREGSRP